jgi:hypothetical protein
MENKTKLKELFASFPDANGFCFTSDGSSFDVKDYNFACSHSQRLEDQKIEILAKDETFLIEKKNLFFEGSKWIFKLIDGEKAPEMEHKTRGLNNAEKKALKLTREVKAKKENL